MVGLCCAVLAQGVLAGVLLSGFFFAHKVGQILHVKSRTEDEGRVRAYTVTGQVFFASAERFLNAFDCKISRRCASM